MSGTTRTTLEDEARLVIERADEQLALENEKQPNHNITEIRREISEHMERSSMNDLAVLFSLRRVSEKGGSRNLTLNGKTWRFEADTKVDASDEFYPVIVHRPTASEKRNPR